MNPPAYDKQSIRIAAAALAALIVGVFLFSLMPVAFGNAAPVVFSVARGEGFREVAGALAGARLIRSRASFELVALLGGRAFTLQPGLYRLDPSMGTIGIVEALTRRGAGTATVTIPEGSNIFQIDAYLADALVIRPGGLIAYNKEHGVEGKLFPDTYNLYADGDVAAAVRIMMDNWDAKAAPLLAADPKRAADDLVLASIVEKEVSDPHDQKVVAGIMKKRLAAGMALNVDATVCYAKLLAIASSGAACYPLASLDFKNDSPYNTYLYKGLPPGPIGNPGSGAIAAVLHPESSPYWYYLSDPKTGKTIFAKTLDEQSQNRVKYLVR